MTKQEKIEQRKKALRLTRKQALFVQEYVLTGNGTQSAIKAYKLGNLGGKHNYITAAVIATENLNKPKVIEAIELEEQTLRSALKKQGVTPEKIAKKIDQLLETEDEKAIDKGLKHALNIYGVEDVKETPSAVNTYNFLFNVEAREEIRKIDEVIKQKLLNVRQTQTNPKAE